MREWLEPGILIVLVTFVVFPAVYTWGRRRRDLPTVAEWRDLGPRIATDEPDVLKNLDGDRYSAPTRESIALVVGSKRGRGRLSQVGFALDVLATPLEELAAAFRSLASQAIVIGLFGTVLVLAVTLGETPGRGAEAAQGLAATLQSQLPRVYVLNSAGIALAIVLGLCQFYFRVRSHEIHRRAVRAFLPLTEQPIDEVAGAELQDRLGTVIQGFQDLSERLLRVQHDRIEEQLRIVQQVVERLDETLVNVFGTRDKELEKEVRDSLVQLGTTFDRMIQRLDEGFQLLAAPFIVAPPLLRELNAAVVELKNAADKVTVAASDEKLRRLEVAIKSAADELAGRIGDLGKALSATLTQEAEGVGRIVTLGVAQVGAQVTGEREGLEKGVSASLANGLQSLQEVLVPSLRAISNAVAALRAELLRAAEANEERAGRQMQVELAEMKGAMGGAAELIRAPLVEALTELKQLRTTVITESRLTREKLDPEHDRTDSSAAQPASGEDVKMGAPDEASGDGEPASAVRLPAVAPPEPVASSIEVQSDGAGSPFRPYVEADAVGRSRRPESAGASTREASDEDRQDYPPASAGG